MTLEECLAVALHAAKRGELDACQELMMLVTAWVHLGKSAGVSSRAVAMALSLWPHAWRYGHEIGPINESSLPQEVILHGALSFSDWTLCGVETWRVPTLRVDYEDLEAGSIDDFPFHCLECAYGLEEDEWGSGGYPRFSDVLR